MRTLDEKTNALGLSQEALIAFVVAAWDARRRIRGMRLGTPLDL